MEYIHKKLSAAQIDDSKWVAKIVVDIPTPPSLLPFVDIPKASFATKTISNDNTTTNIIPFLSDPSIAMITVLENELRYPSGTSFCFEGFKGKQDSQRLITYLIEKASTSDGTELVVGIHADLSAKKNRESFSLISC